MEGAGAVRGGTGSQPPPGSGEALKGVQGSIAPWRGVSEGGRRPSSEGRRLSGHTKCRYRNRAGALPTPKLASVPARATHRPDP
ncbi:hypothetical protein IT084_01750 [Desulfallas sp. Bu1-1]|uniref:hypothetical protein n=1 Tax=Desulfallas sp. Bu1-1 TaxID=2787620 RepID=UPI00189CC001|nr:hypothetical protein [Desulfallas sp. Bu1-1]MBF7081706.1 hypothetical protein [Desulfallas sp. Bu1-1]